MGKKERTDLTVTIGRSGDQEHWSVVRPAVYFLLSTIKWINSTMLFIIITSRRVDSIRTVTEERFVHSVRQPRRSQISRDSWREPRSEERETSPIATWEWEINVWNKRSTEQTERKKRMKRRIFDSIFVESIGKRNNRWSCCSSIFSFCWTKSISWWELDHKTQRIETCLWVKGKEQFESRRRDRRIRTKEFFRRRKTVRLHISTETKKYKWKEILSEEKRRDQLRYSLNFVQRETFPMNKGREVNWYCHWEGNRSVLTRSTVTIGWFTKTSHLDSSFGDREEEVLSHSYLLFQSTKRFSFFSIVVYRLIFLSLDQWLKFDHRHSVDWYAMTRIGTFPSKGRETDKDLLLHQLIRCQDEII